MAKNKKYEINMTEGGLFKQILFFSVPLMATGILQLLYSAVDMIVVGKFAGAEALSAVGSSNSLVMLIVNVFIGLSVGAGVCVSRYYGARNYESINKTVHTGIAVAFIGGIFLSILAFFIVEPVLILMQTPTDVLPGAVLYLKIFFLGMPFNLVFNFGASMMRAIGDTKRPLKYLAGAGLVNVGLNLILVIVFHLSVAGVAIATIVSQVICSILVIRALSAGEGVLKFKFKELKIHKTQLVNIVKIGLPAGIQSSLFSLSNVVVQSAINSFNSTVITAGNAASASLEGFMFVTTNSVTQAAMTAAGQNMGAGKYDRVKKSAIISSLMACLVSFVMGMIFVTFAENLVSLYSDGDLDVVAVGIERLSYMCTFYFACGLMDVLVGQLKGMGHYLFPTIVSFCGVCLFRIGWISIVFEQFQMLGTIYTVYPVSWSLTAILQAVILVIALKKLPKKNGEIISEL